MDGVSPLNSPHQVQVTKRRNSWESSRSFNTIHSGTGLVLAALLRRASTGSQRENPQVKEAPMMREDLSGSRLSKLPELVNLGGVGEEAPVLQMYPTPHSLRQHPYFLYQAPSRVILQSLETVELSVVRYMGDNSLYRK